MKNINVVLPGDAGADHYKQIALAVMGGTKAKAVVIAIVGGCCGTQAITVAREPKQMEGATEILRDLAAALEGKEVTPVSVVLFDKPAKSRN